MSTRDFKTRDEITISIKGDDDEPAKKRRGRALPPKHPPDYLHRRNGPVYLNFYDLGQYLTGGQYRDVPFQIKPNILTTFPDGDVSFPQIQDWQYSNWNDLRTAIEAVGGSDPAAWANVFRKLTYEDAERYGLDFYIGPNFAAFQPDKYLPVGRELSRPWIKDLTTPIETDAWKENRGLEIPRGTGDFRIVSLGMFAANYFDGGGGTYSQMKITTTNDPDAAGVEGFKFDANADIYLYPMPLLEYAHSGLPASSGFDQFLNAFWRLLPREIFLDIDVDFNDGFESPPTAHQEPNFEVSRRAITPDFLPAEPMRSEILAAMKSRAGARNYQMTFPTGGLASLALFPQLGSSATFLFEGGYSGQSILIGFNTLLDAPVFNYRAPIAVIKKANAFYYVWHNWTDSFNGGYHVFAFAPP